MGQLITVDQLVNINRRPSKAYPNPPVYSKEAKQQALANANAVQPPEIAAFVEALTRMFGRIGMHGVCRLCFKGFLGNYKEPGRGCCGDCSNLLADRCAVKPMGCANYMCGFTTTLFPKTYDMLKGLRSRVAGHWGEKGYLDMGVYASAPGREAQMRLTEEQKRRLRWAIRKLDGWTEREAL